MEFPHDLETWIQWLTFAPLFIASVAGFALTMFKFVELRRRNVFTDDVRARLWTLIERRELDLALDVAESQPTRASRIVAALLQQAGRSPELMKDRATQVGGLITNELESGLGGLALIATLGPLFGLFGTVVGIVLVFNRLAAAEGVTNPQQLAGGIGTALYTTIVGLIIGILALVFHRYFSARLDRLVAELEGVALDVVERLSEQTK